MENDGMPSPMLFARCDRAMQYMDAHLAEPITLAQLAAAARTTARRLDAAFKACWGKRPMVVLREKRLEAVRQLLLHPDGTINVKVACWRYGFFHGGDVARYYRETYGEFMSHTLARGRLATKN